MHYYHRQQTYTPTPLATNFPLHIDDYKTFISSLDCKKEQEEVFVKLKIRELNELLAYVQMSGEVAPLHSLGKNICVSMGKLLGYEINTEAPTGPTTRYIGSNGLCEGSALNFGSAIGSISEEMLQSLSGLNGFSGRHQNNNRHTTGNFGTILINGFDRYTDLEVLANTLYEQIHSEGLKALVKTNLDYTCDIIEWALPIHELEPYLEVLLSESVLLERFRKILGIIQERAKNEESVAKELLQEQKYASPAFAQWLRSGITENKDVDVWARTALKFITEEGKKSLIAINDENASDLITWLSQANVDAIAFSDLVKEDDMSRHWAIEAITKLQELAAADVMEKVTEEMDQPKVTEADSKILCVTYAKPEFPERLLDGVKQRHDVDTWTTKILNYLTIKGKEELLEIDDKNPLKIADWLKNAGIQPDKLGSAILINPGAREWLGQVFEKAQELICDEFKEKLIADGMDPAELEEDNV